MDTFWGAFPHRLIEASPDAAMSWITLSFGHLYGWNMPRELVRNLLEGQIIAVPESAVPGFDGLVPVWVRDIQTGRPEPMAPALLELQGLMWRLLAHHHGSGRPPKHHAVDPAYANIAKMTRFVAEHFTADIHE